MDIKVKKVYDEPGESDGFRVLVDRLWPRGMTKGEVNADLWLKDIAPSDHLRKWFSHDPEKWGEFVNRYKDELARKPEPVAALIDAARMGTVTLLYSAKDEHYNNARALREYLLAVHGGTKKAA